MRLFYKVTSDGSSSEEDEIDESSSEDEIEQDKIRKDRVDNRNLMSYSHQFFKPDFI